MNKPTITIEKDGPNANIYAIMGIAHAAMMEEGFRALRLSKDYLRDADLIVTNATTLGNLMKNKAMHAASYEEALETIEAYVTINWI